MSLNYSVQSFSFVVEKLILKPVLFIKVTPHWFCGGVSVDLRLKQEWVSLKCVIFKG